MHHSEHEVTFFVIVTKTDGTLDLNQATRCAKLFHDTSCPIYTVFCGEGAYSETAKSIFGYGYEPLDPAIVTLPNLSNFPENEYYKVLDLGKTRKLRCEDVIGIQNPEFHQDYILSCQYAMADYKNNMRKQGYVFVTNGAIGNALPIEWRFPKIYPGEVRMLYPGDVGRVSPGKKMSVSRPNQIFTWW
jgi:hypothetical protein